MGAGILPTSLHNGKLYFLFGKENKYADTPGWSDFGGGTDNTETHIQTAIREGSEELTGFLGTDEDVKRLLKKTYNIDGDRNYRMHVCFMEYNPHLITYYNNNQRFIQKKLAPDTIKKSKIFEKAEIRWVCVDDLSAMRPEFRSYFQHTVDKLISQKDKIHDFISEHTPTNNNSILVKKRNIHTNKNSMYRKMKRNRKTMRLRAKKNQVSKPKSKSFRTN